MKSYSLQSGTGQLQESWEVLQTQWQNVREHWLDANAARFEEEQLRPLADAMQLAFPAISQMSTVLRAMQRELTDERHQQNLDL